jgi:hypothetical protein
MGLADADEPGATNFGKFDVCICHSPNDATVAAAVVAGLEQRGVRACLYELSQKTELTDGISAALGRSKRVAFGVGAAGFALWELQDLARALSGTRAGAQVVPVFLPSAPDGLKSPPSLATTIWTDLRSPFNSTGVDKLAARVRGDAGWGWTSGGYSPLVWVFHGALGGGIVVALRGITQLAVNHAARIHGAIEDDGGAWLRRCVGVDRAPRDAPES